MRPPGSLDSAPLYCLGCSPARWWTLWLWDRTPVVELEPSSCSLLQWECWGILCLLQAEQSSNISGEPRDAWLDRANPNIQFKILRNDNQMSKAYVLASKTSGLQTTEVLEDVSSRWLLFNLWEQWAIFCSNPPKKDFLLYTHYLCSSDGRDESETRSSVWPSHVLLQTTIFNIFTSHQNWDYECRHMLAEQLMKCPSHPRHVLWLHLCYQTHLFTVDTLFVVLRLYAHIKPRVQFRSEIIKQCISQLRLWR